MLILFKRLTKEQIRGDLPQLIEQLTTWFEQNPKRKICKSQLWYDKIVKIRRKHIEEDLNTAAEAAIQRNP